MIVAVLPVYSWRDSQPTKKFPDSIIISWYHLKALPACKCHFLFWSFSITRSMVFYIGWQKYVFFSICKLLETKTLHSIFSSHGVFLRQTWEPILYFCQFLSFHFWPPNLNYKEILYTFFQLLFYHFFFDFMQNSFESCRQLSFHPFPYLLLFRARSRFFFIPRLPPPGDFFC